MAFYRNNVTGRVQFHPKSGIGETLNATEIGEDGHAVKPRTSLAPSARELKAAKDLMKDHTKSPTAPVEVEAEVPPKTTFELATERAEAISVKTSGKPAGDNKKQEGDH